MTSIRKSIVVCTFPRLGWILVVLLLAPLLARAGDEDPFSLQFQAGKEDPFSTRFASRPEAQNQAQLPSNLTKKEGLLFERIRFTASAMPEKVRPGEVVTLTITGTPLKGNHTYPNTARTPEQDPTQLSRIIYAPSSLFQPIWPVTETEPEFVPQPNGGPVWLEHDKPFTWKQDIYIRPEAKPGAQTLTFTISLQVCDAKSCTDPGSKYPSLSIPIEVQAGKAAAPSAELQERLAQKPEIKVVEPPLWVVPSPDKKQAEEKTDKGQSAPGDKSREGNQGGAKSSSNEKKPKQAGQEEQTANLPFLLWSAFTGALLMLLTPCVFPMIPITVNFFLKQSEKEHYRALPLASIYAGTIIVLLTGVMVGLGQQFIKWAADPWFNLIFGLILIAFALSLFGMFELQLPQGLARFTSGYESKGGIIGAVFMALTFTITSFTCTGPFLGLILGGMATVRPPWDYQILASLVYSTTFAAPFFLLALFPSLLRLLPKSGGWLNTVKVTMGFLELALALKFLSNTDFAWNPGNPRLFTYDSILCAWIALSFACGLYLMGVFRLPHDYPTEHIGVVRLLFATLFFGLTVYLMPALRREVPQGIIGEKIVSFLPLPLNAVAGPTGAGSGAAQLAQGGRPNGELTWYQDYETAWKKAVREKGSGLIFIDFTGVFCTNCRENERNVFPKADVREELAKYVRVQLYTDTVPNPQLSAAEARAQAQRNSNWRDVIGNPTNPYYVIFKPDKDKPFDANGNLNGEVLDQRNGTINNVPDFVGFLKKPLEQLVKNNGRAEGTQAFAGRP